MTAPSSTPANRTLWLLFLALGAAWGSTYLFIEIANRDLGPFTLVASRLAIGTAVLAAVLVAARVRLPRTPRPYVDLAVLAVLNIVVPYTLTVWGQHSIDSGLASVLNSTIPLFTVAMAVALLADERLSLAGVGGLVVGFGGVVLLTAPSLESGVHGSFAGEAAVLLSSASYGAANIWVRRRCGGLDPMVMAFFQIGFAFVATAVLALGFENPVEEARHVSVDTIGSILWLGIAASGLAYIGLFRLIDGWGATRTSTIAYLLPVVGVFLGWAVLHEVVDARVLGGTALVVAGIALSNGSGAARSLRLVRRRRPRGGSGRTAGATTLDEVRGAEEPEAA